MQSEWAAKIFGDKEDPRVRLQSVFGGEAFEPAALPAAQSRAGAGPEDAGRVRAHPEPVVGDATRDDAGVASGDLGLSAARKYDCYGWIPSQGKYREITSTSNCTTFQARRLNIRMRTETGIESVATLNGTLCAMTRMIIMLLENHQQADGSVHIPPALRPFMGGMEKMEPKKKA